MVPQKIKKITLECGLLWNTRILKNESPYCAFTPTLDNVSIPLTLHFAYNMCKTS